MESFKKGLRDRCDGPNLDQAHPFALADMAKRCQLVRLDRVFISSNDSKGMTSPSLVRSFLFMVPVGNFGQ